MREDSLQELLIVSYSIVQHVTQHTVTYTRKILQYNSYVHTYTCNKGKFIYNKTSIGGPSIVWTPPLERTVPLSPIELPIILFET